MYDDDSEIEYTGDNRQKRSFLASHDSKPFPKQAFIEMPKYERSVTGSPT